MVAVSCTMSIRSDDSSEFDPYREWLGLSPHDRPYTHYALLGLAPFERDRQVIAVAAQRQMAQLRKRRQGDPGPAAERLIGELSKATTCLLNTNRKRLYDQHLRRLAAGDQPTGRPKTTSTPRTGSALPPPCDQPGTLAGSVNEGSPAPDAPRQPPANSSGPPAHPNIAPVGPTIVPTAGRKKGPVNRTRYLIISASASLMVLVGGLLLFSGGNSRSAPDDQEPVADSTAFEDSPDSIGVGTFERSPAAQPATPPPTPADIGPSADQSATAPGSTASPAKTVPPGTATELPVGEYELATGPPGTSATPARAELPPEVPLPFAATDVREKAIRFRGSDRIALDQPLHQLDFAKPFTIELWVRFDKGTTAHWLVGDLVVGNHPDVPSGSAQGWQAWIEETAGGRQRFGITTRQGFLVDYPARDATWRHLAVSGDGTTVSIFVDGRRAASRPATLLATQHIPSPLPLHVGSHNYLHPSQPAGLQGQLRALRISSACRYQENFTPPATLDTDEATEVVFDFRRPVSSRRIRDLSRHARDGTLWGAEWVALTADAAVVAGSTVDAAGPAGGLTASGESPSEIAEAIRLPAPSTDELAKARQEIERLLEAEIASARQPTEQLELAARLSDLARDPEAPPATRFALFEMSVERFAAGSDLSKAIKVIDELAAQFDIDRVRRQADLMRTVGGRPLARDDRRKLAETALGTGEAMLQEGRFGLAEEVAQVAVTAATRIRNAELGKRARQLREAAKRGGRLAAEADQARQTLLDAPDDPAANTTYGLFLCLQRNQWAQGATHLAKSEVNPLREAASAETGIVDGDAESQREAAELWYGARGEIREDDQVALLEHVLALARRAVPGLKGIAKLTLEKRITQIAAELPAETAPDHAAQAARARFEPPREFQALLGRLRVDGRDVGILWKYRSGLLLADANVADVLLQSGINRGHLQLDFVGKLQLAETTSVSVALRGGSPQGATATLFVDGKQVGAVGGEHPASNRFELELVKGEHKVAWQLSGRDLGANSLQFTATETSTPLVVYYDLPLFNAVRGSPSRPRLTVNLMGGGAN